MVERKSWQRSLLLFIASILPFFFSWRVACLSQLLGGPFVPWTQLSGSIPGFGSKKMKGMARRRMTALEKKAKCKPK